MLQVSPDVIVLFFYFDGVSRLVIVNLEAEKAVDSSKRLGHREWLFAIAHRARYFRPHM